LRKGFGGLGMGGVDGRLEMLGGVFFLVLLYDTLFCIL